LLFRSLGCDANSTVLLAEYFLCETERVVFGHVYVETNLSGFGRGAVQESVGKDHFGSGLFISVSAMQWSALFS
jgi:hypothetical protein